MTTLFVLGQPMPGSVAYAATKAALDAFTITFADEGRRPHQAGKIKVALGVAVGDAFGVAVGVG
jgi:NAD(P)-dependent dehydrogenase (short-subunit alcohol dehydrogenase family)